MGLALIVIGLIISYLSWITKKEAEYVDKTRIENGGTRIEANKLAYRLLSYGFYVGLAISIFGVIILIMT